jgi:uncharacterized membrane protein YfhO
VHEATEARPEQFDRRLHSIDVREATFVESGTPALERCGGDRTDLVQHDVQASTIDVEMNCRGMVILADVYSKDWVATVDGRRTRLYAAYSVLRGVVVDRGRHRIQMVYRPMSVYVGGALTAVSWIGLALFWMRVRSLFDAINP